MGRNPCSITYKVAELEAAELAAAAKSSLAVPSPAESPSSAGAAVRQDMSAVPPAAPPQLFIGLPAAKLPSAGLRRDRISSDQLFGGLREVAIEHGGQCYRLRVTSTGKLILTK